MTVTERLRIPLAIGAVATGYAVAGKVGLMMAVINPSASAFWPPTGVAMAACLLLGGPAAAGVWLGAFLVNVTTASSPAISAVIAAGNTLEGWAGAWLIRRFAGGTEAFLHTRGLLSFTLWGGLVATLISPTIGVAAVVWGGGAAPSAFGPIWLTWWLGDATGALLFTPLIILWSRPADPRLSRRQLAECGALVLILACAGQAVFGWWPGPGASHLPIGFVMVPVLLWAGMRLGPRVAASAGVLLAAMALAGMIHGTGPFTLVPANTGLLLLQGYVAVSALTALLVATLCHEQHEMIAALGQTNEMTTSGYVRQGRVLLEAQEAIRRRDEFNLSLLQAVNDLGEGLAVLDEKSGKFLSANTALAEMYGYSVAEMIALPSYLELVAPEDRGMVLDRVRRRNEGEPVPDHYELRVLHRTGRRIHIEASMKRLYGYPGNQIVALVRDVTERRRAEELRRARDIAEAANQAKSRFLATVSHELRTPLTAIMGFANLLLRNRSRSLDPEDLRYAERIQANSRELLDNINDLLDLAKIEAGRMHLLVTPVPVESFINDLVGHFEEQARHKGITITARTAPGLPRIETDAAKLLRILMNLVGNAIKFTERGGVTVRAEQAGEELRIAVEDTGIGIPADKLHLVFEAFQQVDEGSARRYGGVGLGLAICRSLKDMLGGRLEVTSEPGRGSIFTLSLPMRPHAAEQAHVIAGTGGATHG